MGIGCSQSFWSLIALVALVRVLRIRRREEPVTLENQVRDMTAPPDYPGCPETVRVAEASGARLSRPDWLDEDAWILNKPWDMEEIPSLRKAALKAISPAIRRHGIFLDRAVLANIRCPSP